MDPISGYPYQEVQFTKKGKVFKQTEVDDLEKMIADHGITDLMVVSHGWLTEIDGARGLYSKLAASMRAQQDGRADLAARKIGIVGILWPSLRWAEAGQLAGGAAAVGGDEEAEIQQMLDDLKGFFDGEDADQRLADAKAMVPGLEGDKAKQAAFVEKLRPLLEGEGSHDEELDEALFQDFAKAPSEQVLDKLSGEDDVEDLFDDEDDDPAGGAAGLFGGVLSGVRNLVNVTTFYQMKKRAGVIGAKGLHGVLKDLLAPGNGPRLHLVGHSFGGRLVTAAVNGPEGQSELQVDSLCLLQAAFSHNGFAVDFKGTKDGFFVPVLANKRVKGCAFATHSKRDQSLKLPYAIASRLAGQNAANVGSASDPFGAIGSNGAQHIEVDPVNTTLKAPGQGYAFAAGGKFCNLKGDEFISSHGDIKNQAVANAILSAVAIT